MPQPKLTAAALRKMLHYNKRTGTFTWRKRPEYGQNWNTRYAGKVAGYDWTEVASKTVYRSIRIYDWPFLGHRLAILYVTGKWPRHGVDHEDRNGLNNKWTNLRPATKAQNAANSRLSRANTTGYKGVSRNGNRFRATIRESGRQLWLGYYDDPKMAAAAYKREAIRIHGAFAQ